MPRCLKCETERRAGEPRCGECGFPFSHFTEGQVIKPGNFRLQTAAVCGDYEIAWQAENSGPGGLQPVEFRELAPPPAEAAQMRRIYREWSQLCRNSGSALPELLTVLTDKDHFCAAWRAHRLPSLEELAASQSLSPLRLGALWQAALAALKLLQGAAFEFCHGAVGPASIRIVAAETAEAIRFGPPSLAAYAAARSGEPMRARDLQLMAAAFQSAGEQLPASAGAEELDRWAAGPVQAGLQWACGIGCEPATSAAVVLQLTQIASRAYAAEQQGSRELARNQYRAAAEMANVPFVAEALRRCEVDSRSAEGAPRQRLATGTFSVTGPQPAASRTEAKTSAAPVAAPRTSPQEPAPPSAPAADPRPETPRAQTAPSMQASAAPASKPIEPPASEGIPNESAPASDNGEPEGTPAATSGLEIPPETGSGASSAADAVSPPDVPEAVPEPAPDSAPHVAGQEPADTPPPTRKVAAAPSKKGPKTRSGVMAASRPPVKVAGSSPQRLWIVAAGVVVVALAITFWLLHPNSRLEEALRLVQSGELVSAGGNKPSAYALYRQAIDNDGPTSSAARAIADAARPKLDDAIKRALSSHYIDSNAKDVNWAELSSVAKWRQELSGGSDPKMTSESLFCQGMEKLEENRLAEAIQAFDGSQDALPGWALPKDGKAHALFRQGRPNDAETAYREAARLDPKWPEPLVNLGNLYMESFNDLDKAEQNYRAALAIEPDLPAAHYFLGELYYTKGPDFFAQSCSSLQSATAGRGPRALDAHMRQYASELMQSVCK